MSDLPSLLRQRAIWIEHHYGRSMAELERRAAERIETLEATIGLSRAAVELENTGERVGDERTNDIK